MKTNKPTLSPGKYSQSELLKLRFPVPKPKITFGTQNQYWDNQFIKVFANKDKDKFIKKYFEGGDSFDILPTIENADTTLQFQIDYNDTLDKHNYLMLDMFGDISIWRVVNRSFVWFGNRRVIQFNCIRDIFTEYFSIKGNSLSLLKDLYVIRSTLFFPTYENLKICGNACINDTDLKEVNREKIYVSSTNRLYGNFYVINTRDKNVMNNILRTLKNFTKFFHQELLANVDWTFIKEVKENITIEKTFYDLIKDLKKDDIYYTYRTLPSIPLTYVEYLSRKIGNSDAEGEWWSSPKNYVSNYKPEIFGDIFFTDKDKKEVYGFRFGNERLILSPSKRSKLINFGGYKYDRNIGKKVQWPGDITRYELTWEGDDYWSRLGMEYLAKGWEWNFFNRGKVIGFQLYYDNEIRYYTPNHYCFEDQNFKNDNEIISLDNINGWDNSDYIDNNGTILGNGSYNNYVIELSSIPSRIFEIYSRFNLSRSRLETAWKSSFNSWLAYVNQNFNVSITKIDPSSSSLDGNKIVGRWYASAGAYYFDWKGNSKDTYTLINFTILKEIDSDERTQPIFKYKKPNNHFEAAHLNYFIVGNRVGVFKPEKIYDYSLAQVGTSDRLIYSNTLGELNEFGIITEPVINIGTVYNRRLELEKEAERLRIRSRYGDLAVQNKINALRESRQFENGINRESQNNSSRDKWINMIGGIVGSVGGAAAGNFIAPGIGGAIGGSLGSGMVNNFLGARTQYWKNDLESRLKEFNTNANVQNLLRENYNNKELQKDMYDLSLKQDLMVSAHLTNTYEVKFPWYGKSNIDNVYVITTSFGDKEKILEERSKYGDFINQYHSIDTSKLKESFFISIDSSKTVINLPNLTSTQNAMIKQLLGNGVDIIYE